MKLIKGESPHSIKHNLKKTHVMIQSELSVWEANSPAALCHADSSEPVT